jgi:DNA-binding beta-propeller fold protein YncE
MVAILAAAGCGGAEGRQGEKVGRSRFLQFRAPAGERPATPAASIDGRRGAVLPSGRFVTPAGTEVDVAAPKPFGLAVSPDERTLATVNSGASTFSVTLIRDPRAPKPTVTVVPVFATFMGVAFSPDGERFYASGGDSGNLWVGATASGQVIGSVNLNGAAHPLDRPLAPTAEPVRRFKGAFPGNLALTRDGRTLYLVDQAGFQVFAIDTSTIVTGVDAAGKVREPDNFAAVVARIKVGRYPFGIALSPDEQTLLVTNVGVFQYTHLRPAAPAGNAGADYPLCFPGVGYPDEGETDKTIRIKKIDARKLSGLPANLRDPDGIRCGYGRGDVTYTIPGLGSPNVPASSSVYLIDVRRRDRPLVLDIVRTGRAVGETEAGIASYGGSHPNAVVAAGDRVYVSNGNNDTISILDAGTHARVGEIALAVLQGYDGILKGVEPVALAVSPDGKSLYVAEAGLNAVGVIDLRDRPRLVGHIPVGWWPSSVKVSADGKTLFVASAKGRGAPPNLLNLAPKHTVRGTVNVIAVPSPVQLRAETAQVMRNNGFEGGGGEAARDARGDKPHPIPRRPGVASAHIKHVVFINKENATHDLLLGDITATRQGIPVDGEPRFSLGPAASPNHHELALRYTLADNFFLEPAVSSDGHRWLTNMYTTEFEETHWPAASGSRRASAGDDPEVIANWPGRIGFSDANASPDPHDYNQHGGIYLHLVRRGLDFVNFGNGFELSLVEEKEGTEPTGIRARANIPMEQVVRQRTDHLYPEYNTHIPDAPLPEDPDRFSRFGRFKQVFEAHYVDRARGACKLPSYVDLFYPNDHGGGANDIHPRGPAWDYTRYVQDNDAALGLTVELLSKSPCWKDTVIFVVEDDTQNGLDHVNGHRSIFIAISPWVKRAHVAKTHLSLASIFKTVDLIFGIPPLNQYDAAATDLREIFTAEPDFWPYDYVQPVFVADAKKSWRRWTRGIDFSEPDRDEVRLRLAIQRSEGIPRKSSSARVAGLLDLRAPRGGQQREPIAPGRHDQ